METNELDPINSVESIDETTDVLLNNCKSVDLSPDHIYEFAAINNDEQVLAVSFNRERGTSQFLRALIIVDRKTYALVEVYALKGNGEGTTIDTVHGLAVTLHTPNEHAALVDFVKDKGVLHIPEPGQKEQKGVLFSVMRGLNNESGATVGLVGDNPKNRALVITSIPSDIVDLNGNSEYWAADKWVGDKLLESSDAYTILDEG